MPTSFENKGSTVVVAGSFAPSMFHPLWFQSNDLLGKQETKAAAEKQTLLVSDELTVFSVAGMDFHVRADRIQVGTAQENLFGPVRDLVIGTMQLLEASTVRAVGINWTAHFKLPSRDAWHAAGHKMIPYEFWARTWTKHVGMRNVTVELERKDGRGGYVQVTVQPSNVVESGVYVSVNDHYDMAKEGEPSTGAQSASLLQDQWDGSQKIAMELLEQIQKECVSG
ncbi:hypothetical protein EZ313_19680 [Ramlibacter henchirensis]|uniref:Uncharacterized protein n=1 Tax=Ramlibacter henchirensis TaxID=204072 RepID=A0A4Z0BQF5_9BURK|nr:hypothetical protein [Ramlibacter henchirensis]TFZ00674.1 hypothetical protein EZ313_19680 [Ramlibacter henchirensis]